MSDSSTEWDRRNNRYCFFENNPDGRLIKYDPKTKKTEVLVEGLYFANGVQLSKNEDFVMIVETSMARIQKYYLKGPKKGETEIFAENLPGLPDNIRRRHGGGYWVGLAATRHSGAFSMFDFVGPRPWIRSLITKIFSQDQILKMVAAPYGMLLHLDENGEIAGSLQDPTGQVIPSMSEVEDDKGVLYLGSYFAPFIGKIDANKYYVKK